MSRSIYAVGDIHGSLNELLALLDLIQADAAATGDSCPRVVFLGDYIDRGPDSKGVLDLLSSGELEDRFSPVYLAGNHETFISHVLRTIGEGKPIDRDIMNWLRAFGGAECVESYGIETGKRAPWDFLRDFHQAFPPAHRAFLKGLIFVHKEAGFFFCHGGIDPARLLDKQTPAALLYGTPAFFNSPEDQDFGARIVHGHTVEPMVVIRENRICVDTGAGYSEPGHRLSAAVLSEEGGVRVLDSRGNIR